MRSKAILLGAILAGWGGASAQEPVGAVGVEDEIAAEEVIDTAVVVPADEVQSPYHYKAEVMATTSSGHTPFWLMNNRWGLSSIKQNNGYLRGAFFRDMDTKRRFSWGFGADLAVAYGFTSSFVVQQLYGEVRYRSLELTVGSKERYMGLVNEELGSGDLVFSQNARPVPQVYLAMPRYEYVPLTRHWLAVKGFFSMGMATDWRWQRDYVGPDGRWAEKVFYHTKGLFLRVGDPARHELTVEGGFEMGSHFGGTAHFTDQYTGEHHAVKFTTGMKDLMNVIFGMAGGDAADPDQMGEITNVLGNHVGEWSAAVTYKPRNLDWEFRVFYQHYFDDHSMMLFDHAWRDMLLGFEVSFPRNRVIDKLVYEYLITKDQSGAVYWDHTPEIPEQVSDRDNYYNHYLYPGWSHWGMGMGNPLVISPIFNQNGTLDFRHNRVKGHHLGFSGSPTDELGYKVMVSYTRSWGTYENPLPRIEHNFNAMVELKYSPRRLWGWDFRLGLGADGGRMLGKSVGAMLTISKSGWLKK